MTEDRINAAIEGYDSWNKPWEFFSSVSSDASLDEGARTLLAAVWCTACDKELWTANEYSACLRLCEARIAQSFPWLTPKARKQLVNGAAYQWR